ncbi:MAG: ParB N-terminal domain-containing protein [Deltaproteobacteria bacterium]|nr:ParB N-terminal domain-containing protein [Deltaproteobacteria bacterium]
MKEVDKSSDVLKTLRSLRLPYKSLTVPIDKIDLDDDAYVISTDGVSQPLLESIKAVGLINPPLLKKRKDQRYRIICGRRRILCCQDELLVHIAPDTLSDLDCLKIAISDNRSHRALNLIEQSRGIEQLTPHLPEQNRFKTICQLLDIPLNQKVFQKIAGLSTLPKPIQKGILQGELSLEGAVALFPFEPLEQVAFFELFKGLNLSQSKECELITLVDEIARREAVSPIDVITSDPIRNIMAEKERNRPEKTREVRAFLKSRRFPALSEAEDRFFANLKRLNLGNSTQLSPPPSFEGTTYTVRISFKSQKELKQQLEALGKTAAQPAFQKIIAKE